MKKPTSESRIKQSINMQDQGIYTLKISNFDPPIQPSSFLVNTRISNEEKVMRRREMVQTASSRYTKQPYNPEKDRRAMSSQEMRMQSDDDKINKLQKLQHLNQEISILTPILQQKIVQFKSMLYKKSSTSRKNECKQHNVHFTEYVLRSVYPSTPSVLHSRSKKQCPFMKSVKARNLMNKSMESRPRSIVKDLFKSIELNNASKYASSKRISLPNSSQSVNKKNAKNKGILMKNGVNNYAQRRQSLIARRQRVLSPTKGDEQCRPWQTHHRLDPMDEDVNLIQF